MVVNYYEQDFKSLFVMEMVSLNSGNIIFFGEIKNTGLCFQE